MKLYCILYSILFYYDGERKLYYSIILSLSLFFLVLVMVLALALALVLLVYMYGTGYGTFSPKLMFGRILTVFYASVGIPLTLIYLHTVGDVMSRCIRTIYSKIMVSLCLCILYFTFTHLVDFCSLPFSLFTFHHLLFTHFTLYTLLSISFLSSSFSFLVPSRSLSLIHQPTSTILLILSISLSVLHFTKGI